MGGKWIFVILFALSAATLVRCATMADEMFGEALLNSITPKLKQKLVDVHEKGTAKKYSTSKMMKVLKKRLTPDEVEELEKAYKRLVLPVLQSTLESKLRRRVDIDDVPMNVFDVESEEEILAEDEETAANATRPKVEESGGQKKGKKQRRDSPRDMGTPKKSKSRTDEDIERKSNAESKNLSNTVENKDEL